MQLRTAPPAHLHLLLQVLLAATAVQAAATWQRGLSGADDHLRAATVCRTGNFTQLYASIHEDLAPWRLHGVGPQLMDQAIKHMRHSTFAERGVAVMFKNGEGHILSNASALTLSDPRVGHHAALITGQLMVLELLQRTFGSQIPDVQLVLGTGEPSVRRQRYKEGELPPVFKFCKSDGMGEITVPSSHFFARGYFSNVLAKAQAFNDAWPWSRKTAALFGRYNNHERLHFSDNNATARVGMKGVNICRRIPHYRIEYCAVRKHFVKVWAPSAVQRGLAVDLASQPKADMAQHASYKWLVHLDSQACSSRMEQLLATGSLLVKEESGYHTFFSRLLRPQEHYVPFWTTLPEEVEDVIAWAALHDDDAARIAAAGQAFAQRYLNRQAVLCYWFTLLEEYAKVLRFVPGSVTHWTHGSSLKCTSVPQQQGPGGAKSAAATAAPPGACTPIQPQLISEWLQGEGKQWAEKIKDSFDAD